MEGHFVSLSGFASLLLWHSGKCTGAARDWLALIYLYWALEQVCALQGTWLVFSCTQRGLSKHIMKLYCEGIVFVDL